MQFVAQAQISAQFFAFLQSQQEPPRAATLATFWRATAHYLLLLRLGKPVRKAQCPTS